MNQNMTYSVAERALQKWVVERLRCEPCAEGGRFYQFRLSGSTCSNLGIPIEVIMSLKIATDGSILAAECCPAPTDEGCDKMCVSLGQGVAFLAEEAGCPEVLGLNLEEAAFREWKPEASGCLCSDGNRQHKWRNFLQTVHYYENQDRKL